jgi:murein L,D-transpeptidase YafK
MTMQNKFYPLFFILFLATSLFAKDVLTEYRTNGLEGIEHKMDKELISKDYWEKYLQDIDTTFGYIESYSNILVCDKSNSSLTLYRQDTNNTYQLKKKYDAYTGKIDGDKYEEGDLKTPIGIYNLTERISKVDSFYGPMAFVTSYPNVYDKYKGKNGSGIWIHGLPIEQERDEFTKGCIAINNQSIECLNRNIDIAKTLLIINETDLHNKVSKVTLATILSELFAWRYNWIYNQTQDYLNFYTSEFVRYDGMDFQKFQSYKKRIFAKQEKKTILMNDINVIPYPNTENTFKISFNEIYNSGSFSFTGNKILIITLADNKMKIITEK